MRMIMADVGDRDRGRRRRRRGGPTRKFLPERDKDRDGLYDYYNENGPINSSGTIAIHKPPIILAKNPSKVTEDGDHSDIPNASVDRAASKPTQVVTIKMREDSRPQLASSPNEGTAKGDDRDKSPVPLMQVYTVQKPPQKNSSASTTQAEGGLTSKLAAPPVMTQSMKLVDENFQWCDGPMEMLLDQTDFFVVGVLGLQGTGKSSILSMLAGSQLNSKTSAFRQSPKDTQTSGSHQTSGIDMYVTSERMILLDTQPVLSASVLDYLIHHEKKYPVEYTTLENCIEMQSLQIATFMLTVCNVVLVVQDWFTDIHLLRFLQQAEMLKPPTPTASHDEENLEYYPHIGFIQNKASREDYTVERYTVMQKFLDSFFVGSKLKYKGALTLGSNKLLPGLDAKTMKAGANLFLLPNFEGDAGEKGGIQSLLGEYRGHPSVARLQRALRNQVFSIPRCLLTHTTLSEKNWFHYAARTWESVKKSQLISEYNRLLP